MSDYTVTTDFSVKDALSTGDSEKLIIGSDFDVEFDAIATMSATKYDSGDLASQAQAEAESSNAVLMTPLRLANWADENGGLVGEIQELADPNADGLLGWDDSASASANVIYFTAGTGLGFSTTTIEMSHLGIEDLADPNADKIMFWDDSAGKTDYLAVSTGLDLTTTNLTLSHLGIEALTDPGADRLTYWDDSATATNWLTVDNGIVIDSDDTMGIDIEGLTERTTVPPGAAELFVEVSGAPRRVSLAVLNSLAVVADTGATYTLLLTDAGRLVTLSHGSAITLTVPTNASVAFATGTVIVVRQIGAGQVTVEGAGITFTSPGSVLTIAAQHGQVMLHKTATDSWHVGGDLG